MLCPLPWRLPRAAWRRLRRRAAATGGPSAAGAARSRPSVPARPVPPGSRCPTAATPCATTPWPLAAAALARAAAAAWGAACPWLAWPRPRRGACSSPDGPGSTTPAAGSEQRAALCGDSGSGAPTRPTTTTCPPPPSRGCLPPTQPTKHPYLETAHLLRNDSPCARARARGPPPPPRACCLNLRGAPPRVFCPCLCIPQSMHRVLPSIPPLVRQPHPKLHSTETIPVPPLMLIHSIA